MTLQQMIVDLADSDLDGENGWYRWKEISRSKLPLGVSLPEGNRYAQNVALKLELHRIWSISNPSQRFAIAKYYVSTWGGVPKNNDETLTGYVTQEPDSVISGNGKTGVASWSKVLCIRDPKKYAIFDARIYGVELSADHRSDRASEITPFAPRTEQNDQSRSTGNSASRSSTSLGRTLKPPVL
jgi:hypothetical protein